jgi:hypothetical protein
MTLSLKSGEQWDANIEMLAPPEQIAVGQVQQSLAEMVNSLRSQGINAEWKQSDPDANSNVPFSIHIEGQGYELFNDAVFGGSTVLATGFSEDYIKPGDDENVFFQLNPVNVTTAKNTTVTLKGGKIISTNGIKQGSNTVVWNNPTGVMEAEMEQPTEGGWLFFSVIGMLVLGIGVGGYVYLLKHRRISAPIYPQMQAQPFSHPSNAFCHRCGETLPQQAVFCPNCGNQRLS